MHYLRYFLLATGIFFSLSAANPAYFVFNEKGKKKDFGDVVDEALKADVILFGELHNNPISHWLQLELTSALHGELGNKLILGAEMFEADDQLIIDEYLKGLYSTRNFQKEVKLWNNYETDYKPLLEFAKEKGLSFIATNIPRRYASLVAYKGPDSLSGLSSEARSYIAPLPLKVDTSLITYKEIMKMEMHGINYMVEAQAIKDATMAHFISNALSEKKDGKLLHFNGAFHSNKFEGIYWYLKNRNPGLKILTISTVEQDDISELTKENTGLANFTIACPANMTKTY